MHIYHGDDIPEEGVSHNPEIRKRVMVRKGVVPGLTNFSQSVFTPGQVCDAHAHPDMYEVYLVESGRGLIVIDGQQVPVRAGDCVVVEPGELHSMGNPDETDELRLTYFGIVG